MLVMNFLTQSPSFPRHSDAIFANTVKAPSYSPDWKQERESHTTQAHPHRTLTQSDLAGGHFTQCLNPALRHLQIPVPHKDIYIQYTKNTLDVEAHWLSESKRGLD